MPRRHRVADVEDLAEDGSRVLVDVDGMEIAVFRVDGEYHALGNYCLHQGGPLCEGGLGGRITADADGFEWRFEEDQGIVHCPWHGWMFDVRTGKNVDAERYKAPTYEVEVEDGTIYVIR